MSPDRSRAVVAIGGFCAFLDLYTPQAVLPQLADSMAITPAAAGSLVGATTLAVAGAAPFAGMLSDRFGRKATIVTATVLLAVPSLLLCFAGSFHQILLLRFLQGLLIPAIFSPLVALVNEAWPHKAADIMGYYTAGSAVGGVTGRLVPALLAGGIGWRAGFALLTVLSLLCAGLMSAWLPQDRGPAGGQGGRTPVAAVLEHLRNPALLATFALGASVLMSMVAVFTYVNFHLARPPYSLGASSLSLVFLVYLAGAALVPHAGGLIRRWGRRAIALTAIAIACGGLLLTLHPALSVIIAGLTVFVVGIFTTQTVSMGFVGQSAQSAKATAVGLYVCCYYAGGSAGSVLPGLLVWRTAGWPGCVALVAGLIALSGVMAWFTWRDRASDLPLAGAEATV